MAVSKLKKYTTGYLKGRLNEINTELTEFKISAYRENQLAVEKTGIVEELKKRGVKVQEEE